MPRLNTLRGPKSDLRFWERLNDNKLLRATDSADVVSFAALLVIFACIILLLSEIITKYV